MCHIFNWIWSSVRDFVAFFVPLNNSILLHTSAKYLPGFYPHHVRKEVTVSPYYTQGDFSERIRAFLPSHSLIFSAWGWIVEVGCLVLLNTQYIACCCCHRFYRMQWSHWSLVGKVRRFYFTLYLLLAGCKMTRSTKMHWYLSFSKLVQLKPEFTR